MNALFPPKPQGTRRLGNVLFGCAVGGMEWTWGQGTVWEWKLQQLGLGHLQAIDLGQALLLCFPIPAPRIWVYPPHILIGIPLGPLGGPDSLVPTWLSGICWRQGQSDPTRLSGTSPDFHAKARRTPRTKATVDSQAEVWPAEQASTPDCPPVSASSKAVPKPVPALRTLRD